MKIRGAAPIVLITAALFAPRAASADGSAAASAVDACIRASEEAQRERAQGHLRAARARTAECLDPRCPALIRRDCDALGTEIVRLLPTVVFRVRAPDGSDVAHATVQIDGEAVASTLDGRARELDPGQHDVAAVADGYATARRRIVVEEGVRARIVELQLSPTASPPAGEPAPEAGTHRTTTSWVASGALAGLGVVGLGLFAGLGLSADADFRHLRDTCGNACPEGDADSVRSRFQTADVALGVGVVALAGAVVVYLVAPRSR